MLKWRNYFLMKREAIMAVSHAQLDTDSNEGKTIDDTAATIIDVMNIILTYDGGYADVKGHAEAPLVSTLFNTIKTQKLARIRDLLIAIVSGQPDEVKKILDKDPSFLLYETLEEGQFVTAPSGHKFNLKPYQAALSVDDTQMAKLIKSYFVKLGDEKEADRQFYQQCPEGWEIAEKKKWQPIFMQRDKLTLVIRDSKPEDIISSGNPDYIVTVRQGSPVERELHEFWRLLDATLDEIIVAGKKPFNPYLFLEAWQLYADPKLFKEYFGYNWDDPRALLFWQKVIGYDGMQRFMPVNYIQAFQDWLDGTVKKLQNDQPQGRSLQFKFFCSDWKPVLFYPLQPRGTPGFNFAIYGGGMVWACTDTCWLGDEMAPFSELISNKNSRLTELKPTHRDCRSGLIKSRCEIM